MRHRHVRRELSSVPVVSAQLQRRMTAISDAVAQQPLHRPPALHHRTAVTPEATLSYTVIACSVHAARPYRPMARALIAASS